MTTTLSRNPAPWRLALQALITASFVAAPHITLGDLPLVRFDFDAEIFYLFGAALRAEGLLPLLFAILSATFALLWLGASLGRLWCGWGCSQAILSDLAVWTKRKTGKTGAILPHLALLIISGFLATATLLYFIRPDELFSKAFIATPSTGNVTLLILWALIYLDVAFMGRHFCRLVCPYGKLLTVVTDDKGLTVEVTPELAERCIECGACRRACPVGLDVREGVEADCIRCGRCIEACAKVLGKKGGEGIVRYNTGGRAALSTLLGGRRGVLAALTLAGLALFLFLASNPEVATLKVRVTPTAKTRLVQEGKLAVFITASVANRSDEAIEASVLWATLPGMKLELKGADRPLYLPARRSEELNLVALLPRQAFGKPLPLEFELVGSDGNTLAETKLVLPPMVPPKEKEEGAK